MRGDVLPAAESTHGIEVYVAGPTALDIDLSKQLTERLPWVMVVVIGLIFVVLMLAFRSLLVPLKAAIGILLSIGAALGIVVAVFQWGWGASLIGVDGTMPIISFLPVMSFAILFGLSMDYEVFILSRVREEWLRTNDARESVIKGVGATARVITSAAAIMTAVFGGFLLGDQPVVKMVGLALARGRPARRHGDPSDPRAVHDGHVQPGQLVAAGVARPDTPQRRHRGREAPRRTRLSRVAAAAREWPGWRCQWRSGALGMAAYGAPDIPALGGLVSRRPVTSPCAAGSARR